MMDLKKILKDRGYTISAMAAKMGITQSALTQQIKNETITFAKVEKIASIIGVSVSDLVADDNEENAFIVCPHCGEKIKISVK